MRTFWESRTSDSDVAQPDLTSWYKLAKDETDGKEKKTAG